MKFVYSIVQITTILIIFTSYANSSKASVKNFLSTYNEIIIPEAIGTLIENVPDLQFPSPKKQAYELINFLYDMESYDCQLGMSISSVIKKIDLEFLEQLKPISLCKKEEINQNIKLLASSIKEILEALIIFEDSNCKSFIKEKAKRLRRTLLLMSLK